MKKEISEKRKQYLKEYNEKNREKLLEKKRLYNSNPENKLKAKEYREKNKENEKQRQKQYYQNNKEIIKSKSIKYYEDNKDKVCSRLKTYRKENIDVIRERKAKYERIKRKKDNLHRIKHNVRTMICGAFRRKGYKKNTKTHQILGCSFEDFKFHLESHFEPWMNWDNYGVYNGTPNYGWDIDHIIPQSSAITENDVLRLNHYSNLKPLCSHYNRNIKSNNLLMISPL